MGRGRGPFWTHILTPLPVVPDPGKSCRDSWTPRSDWTWGSTRVHGRGGVWKAGCSLQDGPGSDRHGFPAQAVGSRAWHIFVAQVFAQRGRKAWGSDTHLDRVQAGEAWPADPSPSLSVPLAEGKASTLSFTLHVHGPPSGSTLASSTCLLTGAHVSVLVTQCVSSVCPRAGICTSSLSSARGLLLGPGPGVRDPLSRGLGMPVGPSWVERVLGKAGLSSLTPFLCLRLPQARDEADPLRWGAAPEPPLSPPPAPLKGRALVGNGAALGDCKDEGNWAF